MKVKVTFCACSLCGIIRRCVGSGSYVLCGDCIDRVDRDIAEAGRKRDLAEKAAVARDTRKGAET